jgi:MoaA/NifB/PqqE/SkfB family radical SAM enzyme
LNGWFYVIIKLDGHTSTCCRIHKMYLGGSAQWSFKKIWSSRHMMNMRLLGKYGHIQKMFKEACQTCPHYEANIRHARALGRTKIK